MTTDITKLAQSLKAAAEKATPGEWVYFPKNTSIEYDVGSDESQGSILYVDSGDFTQAQTDRNGEFIALANPANILALVEALEKAQTKANVYDMLREDYGLREKGVGLADFVDWQANRIAELDAELEREREKSRRVMSHIAELESRTVTVKPMRPGHITVGGEKIGIYMRDEVDEFIAALAAAGIKVEAE